MSPPLFADLGKSARDVFSRGYTVGAIKLDTTTRSGDIEFKTNCLQNTGTGKLFGGVDVKYKIPAHGITLSEKWNTENNLSTEVVIDNKLLKGLKVILETAYAPYVGKRSGKVKTEFKHDVISINADVNIDTAGGPIFNFGGVVGYQNFYLGAHTGFDPSKSKLTHTNFGVAFDKGEFGVHALVNNGNEFGGNLYHRVNSQLEMAANLNWTSGEQATRFGVGAKYDVDRDTVVRAKIDNASRLGVGLTHTLKPGLKLSVSALINLPHFSEGGHKLGLAIEYDPPVRKL